MTPDVVLPYEGILPVLEGGLAHAGPGSTVIGAVTLGGGAWLGADSVVRADGETVTIGIGFHLGAGSTVHIATDSLATRVGDRVVAGRNAVIHACSVGSDTVIEDDCVILDGARVGDGVLIEAGSVVFPRSELASGFVYGGSPAKQRGAIAPASLLAHAAAVRRGGAREEAPGRTQPPRLAESVFVARNARVHGSVTFGAGVTVLFSCELDARSAPIAIGADSNVQDNSVLRATDAGIVIGRETTIGHNVRMSGCRVGARSLIGIGCTLAPGTIVADDVLLAAGASTQPGQLLEGGHLWGGRPARILAPLDDDKRAMMRRTVEGYRMHGRTYRRLQDAEV